jgi:hypothetical protein
MLFNAEIFIETSISSALRVVSKLRGMGDIYVEASSFGLFLLYLVFARHLLEGFFGQFVVSALLLVLLVQLRVCRHLACHMCDTINVLKLQRDILYPLWHVM